MPDEIVYTQAGRTYRVRGLAAKARAVFAASQEAGDQIAERIAAANRALESWRGPHAVTYAEELNAVLGQMAALKVALWQAHTTLENFPDPPASTWASVRHQDSIVSDARVDIPVEPGTVSAQTDRLRSYTTVAAGQDERFPTLARAVNLDGVTAEVTYQRPLTDAERSRAIEAGERPPDLAGALVPQTDPVDARTLITLPTPADGIRALVTASDELGVFTLAVARAIDEADGGTLALLARDPDALMARMAQLRADPTLWNRLTPAQQQVMIDAMPDQIGALDGLPIAARDRANRIVLRRERTAIGARLEQLRRNRDRRHPGRGPDTAAAIAEDAEINRLEERLAGIRAIESRLEPRPGRPPAYLVGFSAEGNGRAIVAIGNPDTADNVVTYVPGTGSRLAGKLGGDIARADTMAADANAIAPGRTTSAIMWLGYDAPPELPHAATDGYADAGATALRRFQAGLAASHAAGGASTTVLGHSYGSTVVGHAATGPDGLEADNLVFVASPGVGVRHVSELNHNPDRVFATAALGDPIHHVPAAHGVHPATPWPTEAGEFGIQPFASDDAGGHSDYWKPGNPARTNIARIVTGRHDELTPAATQPPHDGPEPVGP